MRQDSVRGRECVRGAIVDFGWSCRQRGNLHEVLSDWSLPSLCNDDSTAETWGNRGRDIGDLSGPTQLRNFFCILGIVVPPSG